MIIPASPGALENTARRRFDPASSRRSSFITATARRASAAHDHLGKPRHGEHGTASTGAGRGTVSTGAGPRRLLCALLSPPCDDEFRDASASIRDRKFGTDL